MNARRPPHLLSVLIALGTLLVTACSSTATRPTDDASYVLAYLKTGPLSGAKSAEERQRIFAGHFANMERLALERKLLIAGPFNKPQDPTWRGIFVLDVATIEEARALVDTDPGVKEQVFVAELCSMRASNALRKTLDLENELKAATERAGGAAPNSNMRGYVMVTVQDAARASDALAKLREERRVVWSGTFSGEREGEGVFVLDAEKVEDADALLGDARPQLGECAIDAWWSTKSLLGLTSANN